MARDKTRPLADEEALQELKARAWPGNIRQLKNGIERALIFTENGGNISRRALGFLKTSLPPETESEVAARHYRRRNEAHNVRVPRT